MIPFSTRTCSLSPWAEVSTAGLSGAVPLSSANVPPKQLRVNVSAIAVARIRFISDSSFEFVGKIS